MNPNIRLVCTSSCQATLCTLLVPLCPCYGQYILYEAVKFDDSFPFLSCGPHADTSVIYSTDPLAVKQPHYK